MNIIATGYGVKNPNQNQQRREIPSTSSSAKIVNSTAKEVLTAQQLTIQSPQYQTVVHIPARTSSHGTNEVAQNLLSSSSTNESVALVTTTTSTSASNAPQTPSHPREITILPRDTKDSIALKVATCIPILGFVIQVVCNATLKKEIKLMGDNTLTRPCIIQKIELMNQYKLAGIVRKIVSIAIILSLGVFSFSLTALTLLDLICRAKNAQVIDVLKKESNTRISSNGFANRLYI